MAAIGRNNDKFRSLAGWGLLLILGANLGCQASPEELARAQAARVSVPPGWTPAAPSVSVPSVPGVRLAAWSGPDGAALILYRTLPIPEARPSALARELANRLTNLPGVRVIRPDPSGTNPDTHALVEVLGPGNSTGMAPSGLGEPRSAAGGPLVPTRQLTAVQTAAEQTLWLTCIYPDAAHDRLGPVVDQMMDDWLGAGAALKSPDHSPNS